jgi:NAD(P)-dependent dehydrogenase (short-subunit alcohol dehydrogenase family)
MTSEYARYPSLKDKTVFVTGGASGIGADIVRAFHAQGSRVAFVDIQAAEGKALAGGLEGAMFIACDVLNIDDLKAAVDAARQRLGPVSVLVNNAANDDRREVEEIDEAYWDWSQNINLRHQFFAAQAVLPQMKTLGGGSIINFSSVAWRYGAESMTPYATAKAAVMGMTRALARSYGRHNIRVNSIEPGAVMTDKQRRLWYPSQEQVEFMLSRQILNRELTGEHIARAVLFLASDDSAMITKQSILVDAGMA